MTSRPALKSRFGAALSWVAAYVILAGVVAAAVPFRAHLDEAHIALGFLLIVLGTSAWGGRALGISVAIASFLLINWFFLPPYNTLHLRNPLDWVILVVFLITSLVAAQLLYRARAERAAIERAEASREADRMKDALVASLSHDLRTPLTTIKALAHELHSMGDERTIVIEEQADRLNHLVNDLLDIARLNEGNLPLDIQVNAADDLLGAVVQHVSGRADRMRLHASLDDPSTLSFGMFDFVHSLRILANLVDNALKYSPIDAPVEARAGIENGSLVFRVADRGPGIPMEDHDEVFTPFYRSKNKEKAEGSVGLGLSISRRLAEAQDGSLVCVNRTGGGMIFELRLPAADPATLA